MNKELQILLDTPRLILRLSSEADSVKFQDFVKRNMSHRSPWRSATGEPSIDYKNQFLKWEQEFKEGRSIRFILFLKDDPEGAIIGFCNFSQIFRGPFQACYLGYHIDASLEGKGLMSEAVAKALEYMFEKQKLHRIMANYMPSNTRSARLLRKLGFIEEGSAKKYLLINGEWEDHILTSLTNKNWLP
ncbi:MAG: GNAT family N-acetyltransferase [Chlamydiae bacterium]|nr:GNAT family N-acetyltransferase [Chlamydiota bacterium]